MSSVKITQLVPPVQMSEGPYWMNDLQCLIFVDLLKGDLHRYFINSKRHQVLHIDGGSTGSAVTFVIPIEDVADAFIVTRGRSLAVIHWSPSDPDEHTVTIKAILHNVDDQMSDTRFNDGKCDLQGRLWAGTMGNKTVCCQRDMYKGSLLSMDADLNLTTWVNEISIGNGLAWSSDKKTFYYIDSCTYSVIAFDSVDEPNKICNRHTVFDFKGAGLLKDMPDGMCIDEIGNLWVACFFGKKVICIDPKTGKLIRKVELPAQNITSVCWGGENYSTLYVTSTQSKLSAEDLAAQPEAGSVFAITGLGVKGLPPNTFRVNPEMLKDKINS